ncbi:MAG: hypothetical protein AUF65_01475 [Chloroflexi bacterium 13_1_20CM_50_12]|nr:MAG: hypothetical protein AUF65_01475 [Chloroflexi bacterium 13_1_20CM_50_12]
MTKYRFEQLVLKLGFYVVHSSMAMPRFAVALRNGTRGYQRSIFQFEPTAFRAMTEEQAKEYIKKCKDSMRRELESV